MKRQEEAGTGPAEAAYVPDPRRWRILGVSLVVGFMSLLDVTIVNVALPSIRAGLDTTPATVQWVVSGYALAFGLTLVAGGRLGDAYGRRRLMLIGLIGFVVVQRRGRAGAERRPGRGRAAGAGRVRRAADAAELRPDPAAVPRRRARPGVRDVRADRRRSPRRPGRCSAALIIALAGEEDGWRWLFLVNVPIGLVALVGDPAAGARPAADARRGRDPRLDVVGALLLGGGGAAPALPAGQPRGRAPGCRCSCCAAPVAPVGVRALGAADSSRAAGRRCSTCRCCAGCPATPAGWRSARSTSPGSPGSSWCSRCTCRRRWTSRRSRPALLLTPFALGAAATAPLAGRLVSPDRTGGSR